MKILHIIPSLNKGGAERLVLDICREISLRKEHEVRLLTFSDINDYPFLSKDIRHDVVPSKMIPSITGKSLVQIDALVEYIKGFNPDVIHSHLFIAEIVSRWHLFPGVKYFSHCHDNMPQFRNLSPEDFLSKKRITELYEKRMLAKKYRECCNYFVSISKDTSAYLKKTLPSALHKNILFLPNAVDIKRFSVEHKGNDIVTFVNVGSFVPKKNQKFFIPVARELRKHLDQFKFVLLGDGPLRNEFLEEIKIRQLEKFFELPGNVNNVEAYYAKAELYLHSATYEPFGLVLIEAMAAGLPVICLDGRGNRDILENGKNGLILDENDPVLFAEKILELLSDVQIHQQMSIYAKAFSKQYDIISYVDKLLLYYSES